MSGVVTLQCWDRSNRVWRLDPELGALEPIRFDPAKEMISGGFVKRGLVGSPLIVYSLEGVWYLQIKKERWPLADPELHFEVRRWGCFTGIKVRIGPSCHKLIYGQPLDYLSRRLDPTYDDLDDSIADFPLWLAEKRGELAGVEQLQG